MSINIVRPTKRSCSFLIKENIPDRLSPLFLYDSSIESSILDQNGTNAEGSAFTGKVRGWRDLSGSDRHLQAQGTFVDTTRDLVYAKNNNSSFPLNSSVIGTGAPNDLGYNNARRLERALPTPIINQSFEMFLVGGFNKNPQQYESFFSTGNLGQEGAFQLCSFGGKFTILSQFNNNQANRVSLNKVEVGVQNFRLTYNYENNKNLKVFINGNLSAEVTDFILGFHSFRLFCNRNAAVEANATIKYLAVFGQLLSSQDAKDYSAFQQCKFAEVDGDISQLGSLSYTDVQQLGTSPWAYAALRLEPSTFERKISVLSAIIQPSLFGQNFSARIFLGGDGSSPVGDSSIGFTQAEGYSSNTTKNAQEIQFGRYDPSTNMADEFLKEAVIIPPNQYAWLAITSQSPWGIGYENVANAVSASEISGGGNATPPHQRGDVWEPHQSRKFAIMYNEMRML